MKQIYKFFSFFATLMLITPSVFAVDLTSISNSDWAVSEMSRARLLSVTTGTGGQKEVVLGVHIQLDRGWKTYWRSPGDTGIAPTFGWSGSENIANTEILWPAPESFESAGYLSWGFETEVLFPVKVTLKDADKDLRAKLVLTYGVCKEVCVPIQQEFSLHLPNAAAEQSAEKNLFQQYTALVPAPLGLSALAQRIEIRHLTKNFLEVTVDTNNSFENPELILEGEDGDFFAVEKTVIDRNGNKVSFSIAADFVNDPKRILGRKLRATLIDNSQGAEASVEIK
ncbi:hypothetical protein A9Q83_09395 [Alphaproteobacteria bacterium 46_93_T64]|nr:hypothetical protein A9Q83_09395 [Alphaproteobacteria bacterium 46_93_T64]